MIYGPKAKDPKKTGSRLFKLVFGNHKTTFVLVIITIIISSFATVQSTLFLKTLVDGFIVPMLNGSSKDFSGLAAAIFRIGIILALGALSTYATQRLMVNVANDTLRDLRKDMSASRHIAQAATPAQTDWDKLQKALDMGLSEQMQITAASLYIQKGDWKKGWGLLNGVIDSTQKQNDEKSHQGLVNVAKIMRSMNIRIYV